MPTYEYKCENCGYQFDIIQSMKDTPLTECPECHKNKLKKLISGGAGLIFKGTGFYLTDYKKATSADSTSKKSESKTTSAAESKPAAAAPAPATTTTSDKK